MKDKCEQENGVLEEEKRQRRGKEVRVRHKR